MGRVVRRLGFLVIAIVVVVIVAGVVVVAASNRALAERVAVAPPPPVLGRGSVERGKHIFVNVSSCVDCHGADGGGAPFMTDAAMMLLDAPNLTRGTGGVGGTYSDADYDRAIRRGVRPDGTRLLMMPSWDYAGMSDDDAASVIAYLRSLTPVDRVPQRARLGPVARVLIVTGKLDFHAARIAADGPPPPPPPPMKTVAYGAYLTRIGGCMSCHGVNLSGGHIEGPPNVPPASNLTSTGIGSWSVVDFMRTLSTGKDPSGHQLHPFMPWRNIRGMTDDELSAIYEYLKTVPARPTGTG